MLIHTNRIKAEPGVPSVRLLMSDLHLMSPNCDRAAIFRDLDTARRVGARILVNGDVFDAIGPRDKRYTPGTLDADKEGELDLLDVAVDDAFNVLAPYADLIDVIGIGNHEFAWLKYYHSDPVKALIRRLNDKEVGGHVKHGGYTGFIVTEFHVRVGGPPAIKLKHRLLYHHGAGGDSPVTKGTIDMNRKGVNWEFDAYTFGHKHNRLLKIEHISRLSDDNRYQEVEQLHLQTGCYYRNYKVLTQRNPTAHSYAVNGNAPPKPMGGWFLTMRPVEHPDYGWMVRQDASTDIIDYTRPTPCTPPKEGSAA